MKFRGSLLLFIVLVITFIAALSGCATTKNSTVNASGAALQGMVYNENRMPVQDVSVSLGDSSTPEQTTLTDIHGRFSFTTIPFGNVTLHLKKDDYEIVEWSFSFTSPTQVVYVRMANLDELLDYTADAIQKKDWTKANSYLERIEHIDPDNHIARFLTAELFSAQGDFEQSVAILEGLSTTPESSFAVELALSDLYQNRLSQPDKALLHLKKASTLRDDADVESRIAALEERVKMNSVDGSD